MKRISEHVNGSNVRVVRVPLTNRWLTRFNKRFGIEKHWDGTFDSRLGRGYCTGGPDRMEYNFFTP